MQMTQNIVIQATRHIFLDLVLEILYFPIWWYSQGLKRTVFYVLNSVRNANQALALTIMFKNLFKPMFGQYDRQGRIISFFMRLIILLVRLVVFLLLFILYFLMIAFWLILPVAVVWGIAYNLSALWK